MAQAYLSGAYMMAEIGWYFGVHYMTVSRAVKKAEESGATNHNVLPFCFHSRFPLMLSLCKLNYQSCYLENVTIQLTHETHSF
ncbi:MAG: hypothetical protein ABW168_26730 [Sedimenticola sp.]